MDNPKTNSYQRVEGREKGRGRLGENILFNLKNEQTNKFKKIM